MRQRLQIKLKNYISHPEKKLGLKVCAFVGQVLL